MNNIKLEYFRLILTENEQKSLLPQYANRAELINDFFLNDIDFVSKKRTEYKYRFRAQSGNYILGLIYKKRNVELLEDPDNNELQEHPNWTPEIVVINNGTILGENSQLFIIQSRDADKSLSLLNNCLANKINRLLEAKNSVFSASFSQVLEDVSCFWELSACDNIKELIIDYTMPNFLGIGDTTKELSERLKHIKEQTNATNVKEIITSKTGTLTLKKDDSDLSATLELAKQGQGSIILKNTRRKIIYDSQTHEKIKSDEISIGEIDIQLADTSESTNILNSILSQLGLNNEQSTD